MKHVVKYSLLYTACLATCMLHALQAQASSHTLERWKGGGTVVLGVRENAPPMSYFLQEQKIFTGYHTELCELVVQHIAPAARIKYLALTPQNSMALIQNGVADFNCASMTNNLLRQRQVAFSLTTYMAEVRMAVPRHASIQSFRDLHHKKVAMLIGTTSPELLHRFAEQHRLKIHTLMTQSQQEAFLLLQSERVDAFVLDDNMLAGLIAQSAGPHDYKIVGEALGAEPIAIQFSKADPALKPAVDGAIRHLIRSGELERLYHKWYTQPIPPKGVNLQLPMGRAFQQLLQQPNDLPVEQLKVLLRP